MSSRLSSYGEYLPLPPLNSLQDGGPFAEQNDEGTLPIGSDLDDEIGVLARAHVSSRRLGILQFTSYDNEGDRMLYDGEYSWRTRYQSIGLFSEPVAGLECAAEYMDGDTGMGEFSGPHVQLDFDSWYALISRRFGAWRLTGRYEEFSTTDIDKLSAPFNADPNDEEGSVITLALFFYTGHAMRIGVEWIRLDVDREEDLVPGSEPGSDGDLIQLEARWTF